MSLPRLVTAGTARDNPARLFLESLFTALTARLAERPISRSRQPAVTAWLDERWSRFAADHPGSWLLFDGCEAVGLKGRLSHGYMLLAWKTAFHPAPRYGLPTHIPVTPLGFFRKYDLYASYRELSRPELVARYGKGWDASVWRLGRHELYPPLDHADAHKEAMRRANLANALTGTQWAKPEPGGSLAIPRLQVSASL